MGMSLATSRCPPRTCQNVHRQRQDIWRRGPLGTPCSDFQDLTPCWKPLLGLFARLVGSLLRNRPPTPTCWGDRSQWRQRGCSSPGGYLSRRKALPRAEGLRAGQAEGLVLLVPSETESEPRTSSQHSHGPSPRLVFRPAWAHPVRTREECWEPALACPREPARREAPRELRHRPAWGLPPQIQGLTTPVPQCGREGQARARWDRDPAGQGQQRQRGPPGRLPGAGGLQVGVRTVSSDGYPSPSCRWGSVPTTTDGLRTAPHSQTAS